MFEGLKLANTQQNRKLSVKSGIFINIGESLLTEKLQVIKDVYSYYYIQISNHGWLYRTKIFLS